MEEIKSQLDIINQGKVNMLVSASAGSGKTFVMIERIVSLIKSENPKIQADVDQMLILTFTNQAANEMSERLERKLLELGENDEKMLEQVDLIKTSDISTIHAFCQKMLKKYFYEANISADFELIDEAKQTALFSKCSKIAIDQFKKEHPDEHLKLFEYLCDSRSDKELIEILFSIKGYMENVDNESDWLKNTSCYLFSQEGKQIILNYFNNQITEKMGAYSKEFLQNINSLGEEHIKLKNHMLVFYNSISEISKEKSFEQNYKILSQPIEVARFISKKDDTTIACLALRDDFKKARKRLVEDLSCYEKVSEQNEQETKSVINSLIAVYQNAKSEYQRQKQDKNLLDFSDLEQKLCVILEKQEIAEQISQNYKYIFVDEFQDTNLVQKRILSRLGDSTIMVVGDVKQSIYGFRGSKPKIFVDMMDQYESGVDGKVHTLNCNFRSSADVLNFSNLVFSKIMTKNTCGLDYKNTSLFEPKAEYPRTAEGAVEVCLVNGAEKNRDVEINEVYDLTKDVEGEDFENSAKLEARVVATKILEAKNSQIYDIKLKSYRQTNFSDMTILVRSRTNVDVLCEELIACGVPIVASSKLMLCDFPEIKAIITMLKLIQNSKKDILLASGLASYFGKISFDELAEIRSEFSEQENFTDCVEKYFNEKNDEICKKIGNFYQILAKIRELYKIDDVATVVHYLINQTGYLEFVHTEKSGEAKLARLQNFDDLIVSLNNLTLGELIEYLENPTNGPKAPNFSTGDLDCVNISTMHSSKGLEYPIVFLYGCGADLFKTGAPKRLSYSSSYGFALPFVEDETEIMSMQKLFLKYTNRAEEFTELIRLLYVAMTRAKNKLYITGVCDINKIESFISENQILQQTKYINLILGAMDEKTLNQLKACGFAKVQSDKQNFSVEIFSNNSKESVEQEKQTAILSKPSKEYVDALNEFVNFCYPNSAALNLAVKNSVSSLAFEEREFETKNLAPQQLTYEEHEEGEIQANDLGTLYHKVFEQVDFETIGNIEQLNKAIKAILSEQELKFIDSNKIYSIIKILTPKLNGKVLKEQEFIMTVPHRDVIEGGLDESVVIQGKLDLMNIGEDVQIYDYKLTKIINENILKQKYKKQLSLYAIAVEKSLNKRVSDIFIVDINHSKLIKLR